MERRAGSQIAKNSNLCVHRAVLTKYVWLRFAVEFSARWKRSAIFGQNKRTKLM